jgi:epoxide hydrolase-like predicted phosphatase
VPDAPSPAAPSTSAGAGAPGRTGLLVDFGGVLTTNVFDVFAGFCEREGLPPDRVRLVFREDPAARDALAALELGRIEAEEFAARFAPAIGVPEERVDGLVDRLWADLALDLAMVEVVARARAAGVPTGLISNSWGSALIYDEALLRRLFDGRVLSHLEGIRKPDPRIYALGARRIGLAPEACVFVDDLPGNLKPARAMGMATVAHADAARTAAELEALLGVALTP